MSQSKWTSDPLVGTKLANFQVQKVIGRGGMATVYRGLDVVLDRQVAIKAVHHFYRDNPIYVRRMQRESRLIATWRHHNIVQVYYADFENDLPYFVMEYIDGPDLREILDDLGKQSNLLPIEDVLRIGSKLGSALDFAHSQGVIHRDVKPSNVMLSHEGNILLTDFGLALEMASGTLGESFGTPHYMAPEQAQKAADATEASDIYSLGVMMFEMLTGKLPFEADSVTGVLLKTLSADLPEASLINTQLPSQVDGVFANALSRDISQRYSSAQAFLLDLYAALEVDQSAEVPLEDIVANFEENQDQSSKLSLAAQLIYKRNRRLQLREVIEEQTVHDRLSSQPTESDLRGHLFRNSLWPNDPQNRTRSIIPWLTIFVAALGAIAIGLSYFGLQRENAPQAARTGNEVVLLATESPTRLLVFANTEESGAPEILITKIPTIEADGAVEPTEPLTEEIQLVETEESAEPEPSPTRVDNPDLIVIYPDPLVMHIYNPKDEEIDVALLSFVALDQDGVKTNFAFRANRWGRTLIEPMKCNGLEIGFEREALRDPRCLEFNWLDFPGQNELSRFWLSRPDENISSFGVYFGGEFVRLCETEASVCRVSLQEFQ